MFKTYELVVTVRVYKDIHLHDVNESISDLLKVAYQKSNYLLTMHTNKGLKHGSFSNFYPIEKEDLLYKRGSIYTFKVRSLDKDFITLLNNEIQTSKTENLFVIGSVLREFKNEAGLVIDKLKIITPVLLREKDGNFHYKNVMDFINKLTHISNSKYSKVLGTYSSIDFIESVDLNNSIPGINYKNYKYYGKTGTITLKKTTEAQEMGYYLIAAGLGESTLGLGLGFVNPIFNWEV